MRAIQQHYSRVKLTCQYNKAVLVTRSASLIFSNKNIQSNHLTHNSIRESRDFSKIEIT